MIIREVAVEIGSSLKTAKFKCDRKTKMMTVLMPDGSERSYTDADLYMCFGKVRKDYPDVKFLCKGSKLNVHPSRMSSQMSGGIIAYEVTAGEPADDDRIVNIFDYEDRDLTNNIQEQINYYLHWMQSLNKDDVPSI
ncbi:hypothetical protein [Pseudomonas sp. D1-2]|uniref:hypothetical protein n=1 Tax=unclassified Pseudomonas TaxID=196821 RepID=UPI003DA92927